MWLLYVLSWLALFVQILFLTIGIVQRTLVLPKRENVRKSEAPHEGRQELFDVLSKREQVLFTKQGSRAAGLYYIAELVEEYTVISKRVITWMTIGVLIIYLLFIFFEDLTMYMILGGILSQTAHLFILSDFPFVAITSPSFIIAVILFFINHYLAFVFFSAAYHSLSETMAYFTLCLWLVPFALFVSLSANEHVLPTVTDFNSSGNDDNVLTNYLSKRGKKLGLLSLFHSINDYILPQRSKKMF